MDVPTTTPPPSYVVPAGAPAGPPQNVLSWVALGLGAGAVLFGALTSIAAIITGHIALSQIRAKGELGRAAALTGLILGYVFTALNMFALVGVVMLLMGVATIATSPGIW